MDSVEDHLVADFERFLELQTARADGRHPWQQSSKYDTGLFGPI